MPGQPEPKHASRLDDDLAAQRRAGRRIALLVAAALVAALLWPFLAWQLSA